MTRPRRYAPLGVTLAVCAVLVALGYGIDRWTRSRLVEQRRGETEARIAPYSDGMSIALNRRIERVSGLKNFVEAAQSLAEVDRGFPILAAGLLQGATGVKALELSRGGVIRWVYPRKGNEAATGLDLNTDSMTIVLGDVARAMRADAVTLAGPRPLAQGGVGLVARQRIESNVPGVPDLASVVLDIDSLFTAAGLAHGIPGLKFVVLNSHGVPVNAKWAGTPADPVSVRIDAPDGAWRLVAEPVGGWYASVAAPLFAFRLAWFVVTVLIAGVAYLITERQQRLTAAVNARTLELERANAELRREVHEREQAEAALRRQEEQLLHSQKMEAMGTLAGGVAHDFNNVLTAIIGFGGLALDRVDDLERAAAESDDLAGLRDDIQEIMRAADHATVVTNQLLSFSRKQMLQPELLDVGAVVRETEVLLQRLIGDRVRIETRVDQPLPRILADRGQLTQVVVNLAVNARDAMPEGGRLTVEVTTRVVASGSKLAEDGLLPGRFVELTVSDTGSGIAPDVLPRIFEPFFTTKGLGKGTGLGLSTVYGIAVRLGGRVLVDSDVGRGTTLRVLFPEHVGGDARGVPRADGAGAAKNAATILLVEDEAGVRQLAARVLVRAGFNVVAAASGEEALSLSAAHPGPIHLLLTDLVMPGISGRTTAERLHRERPEMPILFMSGYSDEADMLRSADGGRATLISKPFTPEILERRVREALSAG